MTKGRRTNNRHKRKRIPDDPDLVSRGTQAGILRKETSSPTTTTLSPNRVAATHRFLDGLRKRFRRRAR